jgi:hypothetical protein
MTDERESEGGKRERSGGLTVAVMVSLVLPVVYVLSNGIVIWLWTRGYISDDYQPVIMTVYTPIYYLNDHSPTFRIMFTAWESLLCPHS